nr:MAG TPA: hypothetical protein [Microviridae sp.]
MRLDTGFCRCKRFLAFFGRNEVAQRTNADR